MSATLDDPYLLGTYGLPSISRKAKGKEVAVDEHPFAFASHSTVPKRDDGQVTLAVQGNGVHVFELGDLHPVSSHTLGPSTSFATAPATVVCSEGDASVRRTYVTLQSSQELKNNESGRVIWAWKKQISGDIGSSQDRQSKKLPHDISYLLAPQDINSVIAVSPTGCFTRMDLDLDVKNTWFPKGDSQKVAKLFVFQRHECRFIPPTAPSNGCVLVMLIERDGKYFLQNVVFGLEEDMAVLEPVDLPLGELEDVVDVSCEPSGNISVLGSNGAWLSYTFQLKNGSTSLLPASTPLRLKALTFTSEKKRSPSSQVSILSLGSSFVLLAGTTQKEIALLLWDIQYGVLLRSNMLPIPSTLEHSANGFSVHLSKGSSSQALLVLSPITSNLKRSSQLRSSIMVVPFSVPRSSTIAGAMGKAALGAPWLASVSSSSSSSESAARVDDVHGRETMFSALQEAIEERRTKDADKIFFDWVKERAGTGKPRVVPPTVPVAAVGENGEPQDVEMAEDEALNVPDGKVPDMKMQEAKKPTIRGLFDHKFVVRILDTVLQPGQPIIKHYSPKICRYLVTKHLVSHSMVNGGLLWSLVQHNDWETIRESFSYVVDLPEDELFRVLHVVVKHHRGQTSTDKNAMVVDQTPKKAKARAQQAQLHLNGVPLVNNFLAYIVEYPASPASWRTALRAHFTDVDDLTSLLAIAEEWLRVFMAKDLSLALGDVITNEQGVPVPDNVRSKKIERTKGVLLPSMENVLTFIQTILDSSFLSLLQNPASHALIQRLAENITPILSVNLELEGLRGPLTPFARAQVKAVSEANTGGKKRDEVDWRKRRKQAQEQAAINLGPYQVEELVF